MMPWPAGYGRLVREEVVSTLDEAGALAENHLLPFWLIAKHQTKARGRRGRSWLMPDGNFAATLAMSLDEPPGKIALRSFVVSLALFHSFEEVTGQPEAFALKWPNDVLLRGGKIAGILLESPGPSGLLLVGVGVNLASAPEAADVEEGALRPVALRSELGVDIAPQAFLDSLAAHVAALERRFREEGFAPIRSEWLSRAARLGEQITARVGKEVISGIFEDVDLGGHLVVRGPRGVRNIAAADVYF